MERSILSTPEPTPGVFIQKDRQMTLVYHLTVHFMTIYSHQSRWHTQGTRNQTEHNSIWTVQLLHFHGVWKVMHIKNAQTVGKRKRFFSRWATLHIVRHFLFSSCSFHLLVLQWQNKPLTLSNYHRQAADHKMHVQVPNHSFQWIN